MRKMFALVMVAMLSLTIALAAVSCGQKAPESQTTEAPPPATPDTGAVADTMTGGMAEDTTVQQ